MTQGAINLQFAPPTREEELALALDAMVGAYDRMAQQFPERTGARAMLDGVFYKPVLQSKRLLGRVA